MLGKVLANATINTINNAHTLVTGFVDGPSLARDAEGHMKNPAEYTQAGMETIIDFAPLPSKFVGPSKVLNASEFSVLHKGTAVLSKPKSEVGEIIRQTNNATRQSNSALSESASFFDFLTTTNDAVQAVKENNNYIFR